MPQSVIFLSVVEEETLFALYLLSEDDIVPGVEVKSLLKTLEKYVAKPFTIEWGFESSLSSNVIFPGILEVFFFILI